MVDRRGLVLFRAAIPPPLRAGRCSGSIPLSAFICPADAPTP